MRKSILILALLISFFALLSAQGPIKAEYYNGINFERYVGTNKVSEIDFYWHGKPPIKGLEPANCSIVYTGQIKTPVSGNITFYARVDDGIQVWVNDKLIISNWQLNDVGLSQGEIYLKASTAYKLTIKYFNAMNEAELQLLWKLPEDPNKSWFRKLLDEENAELIPAKYFLPPVEKKPAIINRA